MPMPIQESDEYEAILLKVNVTGYEQLHSPAQFSHLAALAQVTDQLLYV